jgi:hypothetical protein
MKVKCYRSAKMQATTIIEVERITAVPEPEEITDEDRRDAEGIMLTLWTPEGHTIFLPHSFVISIEP